MSRNLLLLTIGIYVSLTSNLGIANASDDIDISGTIAFEPRWFWDDSLFGSNTREKGISNSVYGMPELDAKLSENTSFRLVGFYRYDETDRDRTRGDVREAYLVHYRPTRLGELEMRVGLGRVFWGATESHHLIDIVNQTDLVENPNEEFKLGQPMIHLTLSTESGIFELFGLPFHRQRTFPGPEGRLGFPFLIDTDSVVYENVYDERHFDVAFRYSLTHSGTWTLGLVDSLVPIANPLSYPILHRTSR